MAKKPHFEEHRGVKYSLIVSHEDKGFTAQAAIWQDAGSELTIRQVIGSLDLILPTRKDAEQYARRLAQEQIEEQEQE